MSNYLITGITGFAGPHLANLLYEEGHKVYGLVRCSNGREVDIKDVVKDGSYENITFLYSDLTNFRDLTKLFSENRFDGVFHLAAQSHPPTSFKDPIGTMENNVIGTSNLVQAIVDNQPECRLMFCSTSEVYGNVGRDGHILTIEDKILPSNPYGVSKAASDLLIQERVENGFLDGFITRAFSHTGPRRGRNFSISSDAYQIARIIKGYQENVVNVGNLESTRVVMDVRDTVSAYYCLMNNRNTKGGIYNICGDTPRKMSFFTDSLIQLSNLDIAKEVYAPYYRPIDIHYQHGDNSAVKRLGWEEKFSINRTLGDLLDYWVEKVSE